MPFEAAPAGLLTHTQVGRPRKYDIPGEPALVDSEDEDCGGNGGGSGGGSRGGGRTKYASKAEALARRWVGIFLPLGLGSTLDLP